MTKKKSLHWVVLGAFTEAFWVVIVTIVVIDYLSDLFLQRGGASSLDHILLLFFAFSGFVYAVGRTFKSTERLFKK